jgi:hypothetical protein
MPFTPEQLAMHDNAAPRMLAAIWVMLSVALIFLGLRVYCKFIRHNRLWWDDYSMYKPKPPSPLPAPAPVATRPLPEKENPEHQKRLTTALAVLIASWVSRRRVADPHTSHH